MKDKIVKIIDHQIEMETSINELFDTEEWWLFQKLGDKVFSNHTIRMLENIKEQVQKLNSLQTKKRAAQLLGKSLLKEAVKTGKLIANQPGIHDSFDDTNDNS